MEVSIKLTSNIQCNDLVIGHNKIPIKNIPNYSFKIGEIYGILGTSGIGKTTLLRTIAGLIKPIEGNIKYVNCAKKEVFMMHQKYTSFDWWKVLDNILVVDDVKKQKITKEKIEKARNILSKVGLSKHENKYPKQLSGGQQQRLALARALYAHPKVLLMDEPLSALDEKTRENMQNLILKYHTEDDLIIMVTHSSSEAKKMCNKIIEFDAI